MGIAKRRELRADIKILKEVHVDLLKSALKVSAGPARASAMAEFYRVSDIIRKLQEEIRQDLAAEA